MEVKNHMIKMIESKDKLYKVKENLEKRKYSWQSQNMKIEFSDASFQAHNEMKYVKGIRSILHFYYTVKIYRKVEIKNKWKKVAEANTYDFPTVDQLFYALKDLLVRKEPDEAVPCCKTILRDNDMQPYGMTLYEFSFSSAGFFYDDYYAIRKQVTIDDGGEEEDKIWYSFYAGASTSSCGSLQSYGVCDSMVSQHGMELLFQCVNDFIDGTIQSHNDNHIKTLEEDTSSYCFYSGNIAKIEQNGNMTELFAVNDDTLSIDVLEGEINDTEHFVCKYHNVTIKEINHNDIVVYAVYSTEHGMHYKKTEHLVTIPYNKILHISLELCAICWDFLYYKEEDIAISFFNMLPEYEKELFAIYPEDILFKKWKDAIANRYIVFREEHQFTKREEDSYKNGLAAVKEIIRLIKEASMQSQK